MSRHKPIADEAKVIDTFEGVINAKRVKDIGHKGLVIGTNIEITDTKRIVRREGYALLDPSVFTALYGTVAQDRLFAVRAGELCVYDADLVRQDLQSGLTGDIFSWDEDDLGTVYYTSNRGSNGIIADGVWKPLSLPVPDIISAGVIDAGTWEYRPFNLGARYTANAMQVMCTSVQADGRESAPSDTVTIEVTPEVRLLRFTVTIPAASTRIYCTAPGGSTYYLVAQVVSPVVTVPVSMLNMTATGVVYEYPMSCASFPSDANVLAFYNGVLYAGTYSPASGMGAIYQSLPLHPHMFDLATDFIGVAGVPLLILPFSDGLIIGTDQLIYKYSPKHLKVGGAVANEVLTIIANYGVVPGGCGDVFKGDAYFWTRHGIGKASIGERGQFQYELLTEGRLSVDPGVFNHAHLFHDRGYLKLVASTITGNAPFNRWSER
jgi:hypothetical protein